MKIDQVAKSVTGTTAGGPARRNGQTASAAPSGPGGDSVQLSTLSTQLHGGTGESAVDPARVQEIKQAISEGHFKVNANVVADRLLATVRDLLQNRTLQ